MVPAPPLSGRSRWRSRALGDALASVVAELGMSSLPPREGELLLRREHELVAPRDREVEHPCREPDQRPDDAGTVVRVEEQGDQRHEGNRPGHDRAPGAYGAPIGPLDVREV